MWASAEREGRDLTANERGRMEELVDAAKSQHRFEQEIHSLSKSLGGPLMDSLGANGSCTHGGPGDVFVASKAYQAVRFDR
ncbi:MAG: hypothetical protein ACRDPL_10030, partial [Propionibacteriaceae bacterium]